MKTRIASLLSSPVLTKFIPTQISCLKKHLQDCTSILDIGCGPSSPIQHCHHVNYSVGIEPFIPYAKEAQKKQTHSRIITKKIEDLTFSPKSFDAVIMIETIEHLPKKNAYLLLKNMEKWARKKIIITSPNGFIAQKEIDGNILQKHLSGWNTTKMKRFGFSCHGLAGLKILRDNSQKNTMNNDLTASIRFHPKKIWFIIATLSQIFTYHFPEIAFELFCVKNPR